MTDSAFDALCHVPQRAPDSASMLTIAIGDEPLVLLPEKAIFLPDSDTLLVADAHFGKSASFRRLGVPVPSGTTGETLARLSGLVRRMTARRIVFLGDFLHSAHAQGELTTRALRRWRDLHPTLELVLVRGNHDNRAGDPPTTLGIEVVDEPLMHRQLALCHHPRPVAGAFTLGGHLHPCVSVGGRAHDWHRLPCYWFRPQVGVLPAFGAFTGMHSIRAHRGERVFAVTPERVFELHAKDR